MLAKEQIGKKCLVRCYSAGVHIGVLIARDPLHREALIGDSQIVHSWGKDGDPSKTTIELASMGPNTANMSHTSTAPVLVTEVIQVQVMSEEAIAAFARCTLESNADLAG